jgi:hypothetical protein
MATTTTTTTTPTTTRPLFKIDMIGAGTVGGGVYKLIQQLYSPQALLAESLDGINQLIQEKNQWNTSTNPNLKTISFGYEASVQPIIC